MSRRRHHHKNKSVNKGNIIAAILFVLIFGFYIATQLGVNKYNSSLEKIEEAIDDVKNFNTKDIKILGKENEKLTEDMIPEGYSLEYYENPLIEEEEINIDRIPEFDENGKLVAYAEKENGMFEMSDIEGLTWQDKEEMGLLCGLNSDTDMDGLTDKEEIEVYGTNPKKKSTADDLYTDKYKVDNGMNPLEHYDYEGEPEYINNECEDRVSLEATTADSLNGTVEDITGRDKLSNDVLLYAEYAVYNFSGKMRFKISEIRKDLTVNDIKVLISEGDQGSVKGVSCHAYGTQDDPKKIDTVVLDYNFSVEKAYKVFVVNSESVSRIQELLNEKTKGLSFLDLSKSGGSGIIYGCPVLSGLFAAKSMRILVEDVGESTYVEKDTMMAIHNTDFVDPSETKNHLVSYDDKRFETKSRAEVIAQKEILDKVVPWAEYSGSYEEAINEDWKRLFFAYKYVDFKDELKDDIEAYEEIHYAMDDEWIIKSSGFDAEEDELPFKNFGSYISPGGNCAGISLYTSMLYNKGTVPPAGNFTRKKKKSLADKKYIKLNAEGSWDILKNPENDTLNDRGLSIYTANNFMNETKTTLQFDIFNSSDEKTDDKKEYSVIDYEKLEEYEKNFTDMIGGYQIKYNNSINEMPFDGESYSFETINNIKDCIDSGKIVIISLIDGENGADHAVIGYAYEFKESDPDTIRIICYDSNYPFVKNFTYLEVQKIKAKIPGEETFSFAYYPKTYGFTSDGKAADRESLYVTDDDLNNLVVMN